MELWRKTSEEQTAFEALREKFTKTMHLIQPDETCRISHLQMPAPR